MWPWLFREEDVSAHRAIVAGTDGLEPLADTPGAYRVLTGEAHLPLDGTGLGTGRAALREADHARLVTAGLHAVLILEQLAVERLCHCVRLQGSLLARWSLRCVSISESSNWRDESARKGEEEMKNVSVGCAGLGKIEYAKC